MAFQPTRTNPETVDQNSRTTGRRKTDRERAKPSILVGRLYWVLLIAPWLILLALTNNLAFDALNPSVFFFLLYSQLAVVTVAGMAVGSARIDQLRKYEVRQEHERLLFEHARDGMLVVRVLDAGKTQPSELSFIVEAENPAAMKRFNSFGQGQSLVGCRIEEAFPDWLLKKTEEAYRACVKSKAEQRYEITGPDGQLTHESVATPVLDQSGQYVSFIVVIMRDISERLKHARELNIALKRAETANKSKSEFLASMSHELRTPLNAVIGFSELLREGIGGPIADKQKEYVGHIHESGRHLLNIISDILDLSKIEAGQFELHEETVSLQPLIDMCITMVKERAAKKRLFLVGSVAENAPRIFSDPLRLKQILINLLTNAIKFTDHGSVQLSVAYDQNGFEFTVTDTGIGMTQEELRIAMEPFGQAASAFSRNHDGTGLGLPIAQHLVDLHGGSLKLASWPGSGTRVIITLPPARAEGNFIPIKQMHS